MLIHERMPEVHHWMDYNPGWPQYYHYEPNLVATAHKITDVYQAFCSARTALQYLDVENYGELIAQTDDLHLKFIRSQFIQNALVYYNISIDLSWQVLWLFCKEPSFDLMYENKYVDTTKDCNLETLRETLDYMSSFPSIEKKTLDMLLNHMISFFNDELPLKVRHKYNYMKHRGTYYIDGLGMNDKTLGIVVNGVNPLMLTREELDINEWKETLIKFDNSFVGYFEYILKNIMPVDFKDRVFNFADPINYHHKLQEYFKQKNK